MVELLLVGIGIFILVIGIGLFVYGIEEDIIVSQVIGFIFFIASVVMIIMSVSEMSYNSEREKLVISYTDELVEDSVKEKSIIENIEILNTSNDSSYIEHIEIFEIDSLCYLLIKQYSQNYKLEKINCNTFNIEKL